MDLLERIECVDPTNAKKIQERSYKGNPVDNRRLHEKVCEKHVAIDFIRQNL
jgi:hypothetical protein